MKDRSARLLTALITLLVLSGIQKTAYPATRADDKGLTMEEKRQAVDEITKLLLANYVFPEKAEAIARRLDSLSASPGLVSISRYTELAENIEHILFDVTGDHHLQVKWQAEAKSGAEPKKRRIPFEERIKMWNYGIDKVSMDEAGVGYINMRVFVNSEETVRKTDAAIELVSGAKALILDLRQHIGGSPEIVQRICSYFLPGGVHLNTIYNRPADETKEYYTLTDTTLTRVPDVPLYILTSSKTFSAAEELAYNLKHLKRATIIGETSRGGAHPGRGFTTQSGIQIFIPTSRSVNPITKTNWEAVGVVPHIQVEAENALEKAKEIIARKGR